MIVTDAQMKLLDKLYAPPVASLKASRAIYVNAIGEPHLHTFDGENCGPDAFLLLCCGAVRVARVFPDYYVLTLSAKGRKLLLQELGR